MDAIDYGPQPFVTDPLAAHASHGRIDMAHDRIYGDLVTAFARDSLSNVAKCVKTKSLPTIDLKFPQ